MAPYVADRGAEPTYSSYMFNNSNSSPQPTRTQSTQDHQYAEYPNLDFHFNDAHGSYEDGGTKESDTYNYGDDLDIGDDMNYYWYNLSPHARCTLTFMLETHPSLGKWCFVILTEITYDGKLWFTMTNEIIFFCELHYILAHIMITEITY